MLTQFQPPILDITKKKIGIIIEVFDNDEIFGFIRPNEDILFLGLLALQPNIFVHNIGFRKIVRIII